MLIFVHVLNHLEQFGGVLFLLIIDYFGGWGGTPSPVRGKFNKGPQDKEIEKVSNNYLELIVTALIIHEWLREADI